MDTSPAQYTELVGKPYNQRLGALTNLYDAVVGAKIPLDQLADTLANKRELARQVRDKELLLETFYGLKHGSKQVDGMIREDSMAREAKAFRWYARLDSMLREVTVEPFLDKVPYPSHIDRSHYYFGEL